MNNTHLDFKFKDNNDDKYEVKDIWDYMIYAKKSVG